MAGFKGSGVAINALGVCKMAARFKFGVTLKACDCFPLFYKL